MVSTNLPHPPHNVTVNGPGGDDQHNARVSVIGCQTIEISTMASPDLPDPVHNTIFNGQGRDDRHDASFNEFGRVSVRGYQTAQIFTMASESTNLPHPPQNAKNSARVVYFKLEENTSTVS
jgi:hypothetical protein